MLKNRLRRPVKILPANPKAALFSFYKKKLLGLIDEMHNSVVYWLLSKYKKRIPSILKDRANPLYLRVYRLVMDDSPARDLEKRFKKLTRQWNRRFDELAEPLARDVVGSANTATTAALLYNLKRRGFVVTIKNTYTTNSVMRALIIENIGLIKSIPQKYFLEVQGIIMRGIAQGRDAGLITEALTERFGVVKRRAALIARDQTNKAVETISRERSKSLGITKGVWIHRGGEKKPREAHLNMDGQIFDLEEGCYDSSVGRNVQPGELVNCNCTYSPYIE